jgi:hypothetical protein
MYRIPHYCRAAVLGLLVFLHCSVCFGATAPRAAEAMVREMHAQVVERLAVGGFAAETLSLAVTTPVDVNDLEAANTLARQMQEELAHCFVRAGYAVREIRKGASVLFEPEQGELLLTRKPRLLGSGKVATQAIVSGTYTVTPQNIRFNIRIVATGSRQVLAMAVMTVPMGPETAALLDVPGKDLRGGLPIQPTVVTLLP